MNKLAEKCVTGMLPMRLYLVTVRHCEDQVLQVMHSGLRVVGHLRLYRTILMQNVWHSWLCMAFGIRSLSHSWWLYFMLIVMNACHLMIHDIQDLTFMNWHALIVKFSITHYIQFSFYIVSWISAWYYVQKSGGIKVFGHTHQYCSVLAVCACVCLHPIN